MGKTIEKLTGKPEAVKKLKAAPQELQANSEREFAAGVVDETPEYHRLNRAVLDAERDVPWIRR
jgi:hypothetical protein